jgi:hypothetical protein
MLKKHLDKDVLMNDGKNRTMSNGIAKEVEAVIVHLYLSSTIDVTLQS